MSKEERFENYLLSYSMERVCNKLVNYEDIVIEQGKELKELYSVLNEALEYVKNCDYLSQKVLLEILERV